MWLIFCINFCVYINVYGCLETNIWIGFAEPVTGFLDCLIEWGKLEIGQILAQFIIASCLFELTIGSGSVEDPLTGETIGLGN